MSIYSVFLDEKGGRNLLESNSNDYDNPNEAQWCVLLKALGDCAIVMSKDSSEYRDGLHHAFSEKNFTIERIRERFRWCSQLVINKFYCKNNSLIIDVRAFSFGTTEIPISVMRKFKIRNILKTID